MRRTVPIVAVATLLGAAAGCGGGDDKDEQASAPAPAPTQEQSAGGGDPPASGGASLDISAVPSGELKFDKQKLEAPAGSVSISMDNPSSVPHSVGIEGNGIDEQGKVVEKDGVSSVKADLKPGEYEFYCTVPGHREGGMKGTLTVD